MTREPIALESVDNEVTEAMKRMRAFVLAKAPLMMRTGHHVAGISTEILSPGQRAEMIGRLKASRTYTYDDAARDYKVDRRTVFSIAKAAGVRRRRRTNPEKLREAVRLVTVTGITSYAAEKLTGVPRGTILKAIK